MKIVKFAQENPRLKFFYNMKKSVGINWKEVKEFTITQAATQVNNKTVYFYDKEIFGILKNSQTQKANYVVTLRYICDDQSQEKTVYVILKDYSTNVEINKWIINEPFDSEKLEAGVDHVLQGVLGLTGRSLETPSAFQKKLQAAQISLPPQTVHGKTGYYYHRLTRVKTNKYPASELELFIWKTAFGYSAMYCATKIELDETSGDKSISSRKTLGEAVLDIDEHIENAKGGKGYVGPESPLYIPEGVNKDNWDFVLHEWIKKEKSQPKPMPEQMPDQGEQGEQEAQMQQIPQETQPVEQPMVDEVETPYEYHKPVLDLKKLFGQAQDFEGYFSGEVPDYAGSLIGTPSVDASQISGMFSGTNEAINLVNSYTSDALKNVAYIFNFSKGGAYGVYIPALDRAIKTKALKKQLEQKGYKIVDESGVLTAHPTKEETSPEQIDKDIHALWEQLNSSGGSALGINMSDVLSATQQNASQIINRLKQQSPDIPAQVESILKDVLGVYHLAAIILHEASHAKGGDEGKAQTDEAAFRSWAQGNLNQQYQSKLSAAGLEDFYSSLELSSEVIHALSKSWYRMAQGFSGRLNYSPSSGGGQPRGSDIGGRYQGNWQSGGFAEWAMLVQQDQSIPIEQRLNRSEMAPLERDVDQEHDSIEEQLRKQFRNDSKPNVQLITEELLSPDRDESQGYKALETLLEERRPQPLMTPIQKAAMTVISWKAGDTGLFGWYNNLDISDGSTIPGLSDRVMAWDDRDESFAAEESWIKSQERYNPEYDLKGFYYRWIEPRFKPELFDDMTKDLVNTHPAKRFAATLDPTLTRMLSIMKTIEDEIVNEKIKATRIVISEDLIDVVKRLLDKEGLRIKAFKVSNEDNIFSIWVYNNTVSEDSLEKAEQYFQNIDGADQYKELVEELLSGKSIITKAVSEIVTTARELCKKNEVEDLYIVGEYARKIFEGEAEPFVSELDFACEDIDAGLKIGSALANKLNVSNEFITVGRLGIIFPYKGIRILFSRSSYLPEIGEKMQDNGYNRENAVLRELCNKDFTINMMAYDVRDMKILDPIGVKADVKNKIAKTLFDPSFAIEMNPMIIMRAISLKLDGYELDEDLERSMIEGSTHLCSGKFSPQRLKFTREYLKSKGISEAEALFNEYGLECNAASEANEVSDKEEI